MQKNQLKAKINSFFYIFIFYIVSVVSVISLRNYRNIDLFRVNKLYNLIKLN